MKKPKPLTTVNIFGDVWEVHRFEAQDYERAFNKDEYASTAFNHETKEYIFFFNADHTDLPTVIHEVTHAFLAYQHLNSASLTHSQVEEVFCDMLGYYLKDIDRVSKKIYRAINGKNEI